MQRASVYIMIAIMIVLFAIVFAILGKGEYVPPPMESEEQEHGSVTSTA